MSLRRLKNEIADLTGIQSASQHLLLGNTELTQDEQLLEAHGSYAAKAADGAEVDASVTVVRVDLPTLVDGNRFFFESRKFLTSKDFDTLMAQAELLNKGERSRDAVIKEAQLLFARAKEPQEGVRLLKDFELLLGVSAEQKEGRERGGPDGALAAGKPARSAGGPKAAVARVGRTRAPASAEQEALLVEVRQALEQPKGRRALVAHLRAAASAVEDAQEDHHRLAERLGRKF